MTIDMKGGGWDSVWQKCLSVCVVKKRGTAVVWGVRQGGRGILWCFVFVLFWTLSLVGYDGVVELALSCVDLVEREHGDADARRGGGGDEAEEGANLLLGDSGGGVGTAPGGGHDVLEPLVSLRNLLAWT